VEAYGTVDELNAIIGVARAAGLPQALDRTAAGIQEELFVLCADLATPSETAARQDAIRRLGPDAGQGLEAEIDRLEESLATLRSFILPGGSPSGGALHLARTVCRRAERRVVTLGREIDLSPGILVYLNRLSDLLFVMARLANAEAGRPEQTWHPE
jgi:cob(I)alamin adenosyltransferase